ncbi:MAG: hypothetical protein A3K60_08325 [Euryarchaeota archaeon RBG_19FT_COMBO_56_21]|nr:MAG: hypothetical protein A3K60_08325 [Euryarchaeota archaeon RBG_19FT_COMBO_56_21]
MAMVDVSLLLDAIMAVSIAAGAAFAVLELRAMGKDRRAHIVVDMYTSFVSSDMTEAYSKIMTGEFQSAADMEQKCSHSSLARIAGFYEGIGYLVRKKFVDPKVAMDFLPIMVVWRRMQPWIVFDRERIDPNQWAEFEYLANVTEDYDADYLANIKADLDSVKKRRNRNAA